MADKLRRHTHQTDDYNEHANGGGERSDVVIGGYHPEMAMTYDCGFDNSDPYLASKPHAQNYRYDGPRPVKLNDPRPK